MCKIRAVHISRQKMSALKKSDLYGFKSEKSVRTGGGLEWLQLSQMHMWFFATFLLQCQ